MKKFQIAFLLTCLIVVGSCKKNELPEPTQEGLNTFGMLKNGKKWQPSLPMLLSPPTKGVHYNPDFNFIRVYAANLRGENHEEIEFYVDKISGEGDFFMSISDPRYENPICPLLTRFDPNRNNAHNCTEAYSLIDNQKGTVTITRFDTINQIISGKFEGEMANSENEVLEITNGVFDLKY